MTSAILFAVVDAVLRARERRSRTTCGMSEYAETRWVRIKRTIGWWRSTWQR